MIPIRDHNPSKTFPFVTYALIAANIAVFLYMFGLPSLELENFILSNAFIPREIMAGNNWSSVFTAMFLHGSIGHILGNMLFLRIFGDNLEDFFGHWKYLIFYLLCGLGASLLQIFVAPFSTIPNLGASGAIAGLMGGYLLLFPRHKIDILFPLGFFYQSASVPAYTMLFYWIVAQFFSGFGQIATDPNAGGVAYFAHIGGFITGILLTFLMQTVVYRRSAATVT